MTNTQPVDITIWYDYTCPFSYVGLSRLDKVAQETAIKVDRQPYLLAPDRPLQGRDDQFAHAAAGAYWETGADLGDLAVLQELAQAAGLDWAELAPRLESGYYRQRVLQEHQAAKDRGVGGTPTYMVDGELTFGDLSVEDLLGLVRQAASD